MTSSWRRRRQYNLIVTPKRTYRSLRHRIWRKAKDKRSTSFEDLYRHQETGLGQIRLQAPVVFSLGQSQTRSDVIDFLDKLKEALSQSERRIYIDFSKTKLMVADGTLLFFASLDQLIRHYPARRSLITCSYPKDKIVEQVLQHVGFFNVLKKQYRAIVEHETVKHWHNASGTQVEGEKLEGFENKFQGSIASPLINNKLYDGLVEAMANSTEHAYPIEDFPAESKIEHRWWMFSQFYNGMLTVCFCDLGIGIPAAKTRGVPWDMSLLEMFYAKFGFLDSDGARIQLAFGMGRSRSGKSHRGKGLSDIRHVLDSHGEGQLIIYSRRGSYVYILDSRKFLRRKGRRSPLRKGIYTSYLDATPGTLICWQLRVRNEEGDAHNQ